MLSVFKRFVPIPTTLDEESRYHIDPDTIRKEISNRGLGLIVASNPRNPTGQLIEGDELKQLVKISRERRTTLVMDGTVSCDYCIEGDEDNWIICCLSEEFYSAYIYSHDESENGRTVSIAEYVESKYMIRRMTWRTIELNTLLLDVDEDPVIIIDGLTKNFRVCIIKLDGEVINGTN